MSTYRLSNPFISDLTPNPKPTFHFLLLFKTLSLFLLLKSFTLFFSFFIMKFSTMTMKDIQPKLLWPTIITISVIVVLLLVLEVNSESNKRAYNEQFKFSVRNATVHSFSYNTTTTTFTYDLLLFFIVPDVYVSLRYFDATASYLNHRFASNPDETLVRGLTGFSMRFNGHYVVSFTEDQLLTLHKDHMAGLYNITVTIRQWEYTLLFRIRRLGKFVLCDIQVPLQSRVFCGWIKHD